MQLHLDTADFDTPITYIAKSVIKGLLGFSLVFGLGGAQRPTGLNASSMRAPTSPVYLCDRLAGTIYEAIHRVEVGG